MSDRPFGQGSPGRYRRRRVLNATWRPSQSFPTTEDASPVGVDGPISVLSALLLLDRFWTTIPSTLTDQFTRADSTSSIGGGWVAQSGTWGILSNQGYVPSGTAGIVVQRVSPLSEREFVQVRLAAAETAGLVISYADQNNFVYLVRSGGFATYVLGKVVNGVNTSLVNTGSLTSFTDCTITVYRDGTNYTATVLSSGGALFSSPSVSIPDVQGLGVGLYATSVTTATRWDDFVHGDFIALTETGTGTEGTAAIAFSAPETGSGVEGSNSIVVPVSSSDTGTGTDAWALSVTISSTDTGSGADGFTGARTSTQAETGAGTDANSIAATLTGTDTGAGADGTGASTRARTEADTATGTETEAIVPSTPSTTEVSSSDTAVGVETESLYVEIVQNDSAFGATQSFVRYGKDLTLLGAIARG